ncbi:tagatose-6-phosphate ketose/aldose isomerase [Lentibacillus halodurans]|uniref:Tagatose-6-phosphate ketose/aldose isomerase n=1 Tax=Lentibacillus halodurans TaxID=237679 RepID=A0A1I0YH49_9BACI|nr:SIS domain-containing protein [Lentibacillus halodurans]SFB12541.1 tagatose-6-phosphate ketose/aldose isomerase [Lentibacillus halodurans]
MFNIAPDELQKKEAIDTAAEIYQQPAVWRELITSLSEQERETKRFLNSISKKHHHIRVLLTGAGTSAFIGDTLLPVLRRENTGNIQFEAVPTTDIVSNPADYLQKDVPTIMVSFARSGNSPESVAAVSLGKKLVNQFYQIVITCNKAGQLAENTVNDQSAITILMPDKAHDKGFAMTSSFTCMLITTYKLFTANEMDETIISNAEKLLESISEKIENVLDYDFERIVYLGSGLLGQLSHEAALKMLELCAGKVTAVHESSLGFRHGPKSILNHKSMVVVFMSQDSYTRKYDMDILRELAEDDSGMKVIALTEREDTEVSALSDWTVPVNAGDKNLSKDFYLALLYVIFAQAFALNKSLQLGVTPDNPSPDGRVNRVVQGVKIYDYQ